MINSREKIFRHDNGCWSFFPVRLCDVAVRFFSRDGGRELQAQVLNYDSAATPPPIFDI